MRHKEESVYAPRSLFDRPSPAMMKIRRDMKLHKYREIVRPSSIPMPPGIKPSHMAKSSGEQEQHILDWMIHEDWALLQAIQVYQGLPLNLMILSPGHTPNWDLVADIVNNTSRIYRSPKQCKNRYESVIVPREEGKLLYDTTPKKQKKQKGVYKIPQVSEVKFGYHRDNDKTIISLYYFIIFVYILLYSNKVKLIGQCERLSYTIKIKIIRLQ